jgi:hypothetical protein
MAFFLFKKWRFNFIYFTLSLLGRPGEHSCF